MLLTGNLGEKEFCGHSSFSINNDPMVSDLLTSFFCFLFQCQCDNIALGLLSFIPWVSLWVGR